MIAVDTNILVYAHRAELPKHAAALARLTALAESPEVWAIPVFCLGELARVIVRVAGRALASKHVIFAVFIELVGGDDVPGSIG